jgi:dTMP kinase
MYKKPVIIFEGIEGSGKTYHSNNLAKYLKKKKIDYIKLREPGGCLNSEKIRKLILNKNSNFDKNTDLLLYMAARNENIIRLKKYYRKKVIIIDRFIDSTVAYQHYGLGVNLSIIQKLNSFILKSFKIDFTFLNIVNKANMHKRLKLRKSLNRYDKFKSTFYDKVQKGYLKIAKKNAKKYQIINSNLDIETNKILIVNKIERLIR